MASGATTSGSPRGPALRSTSPPGALPLAGPGSYKVVVKVPPRNATTRRATYRLLTADGWVIRTLDQDARRGKWASLGTFPLSTSAVVKLTDRTGERAASGRMVGFDALKFVPQRSGGGHLSRSRPASDPDGRGRRVPPRPRRRRSRHRTDGEPGPASRRGQDRSRASPTGVRRRRASSSLTRARISSRLRRFVPSRREGPAGQGVRAAQGARAWR